jgi:hypothetical protein
MGRPRNPQAAGAADYPTGRSPVAGPVNGPECSVPAAPGGGNGRRDQVERAAAVVLYPAESRGRQDGPVDRRHPARPRREFRGGGRCRAGRGCSAGRSRAPAWMRSYITEHRWFSLYCNVQ